MIGRIKKIIQNFDRSSGVIYPILSSKSLADYLNHQRNWPSRLNKKIIKGNSLPSLEKPQENILTIDNMVDNLDKEFDKLKEMITQLITLGVEERVKEYKKQTDGELKELKEVVELAQRSNWAENIKRSLLGG